MFRRNFEKKKQKTKMHGQKPFFSTYIGLVALIRLDPLHLQIFEQPTLPWGR